MFLYDLTKNNPISCLKLNFVYLFLTGIFLKKNTLKQSFTTTKNRENRLERKHTNQQVKTKRKKKLVARYPRCSHNH